MKRLASFILAFIFLGSNLGFAVGTHFCGGHAMDTKVVLGHEDLSCGMMPEMLADPEYTHTTLHTVPCCENEFQSLQLNNEFQNTLVKVAVEPVAALSPLFVLADFSCSIAITPIVPDDTSPKRSEEISLLLQVFRI